VVKIRKGLCQRCEDLEQEVENLEWELRRAKEDKESMSYSLMSMFSKYDKIKKFVEVIDKVTREEHEKI